MKAWVLSTLLLCGLTACTSVEHNRSQADLELRAAHQTAAGALVFDPPITQGQPPLMLARADREPGAFIGYQNTVMTWFYQRHDDWQMDGYPDQYNQRAISVRVGVRYR